MRRIVLIFILSLAIDVNAVYTQDFSDAYFVITFENNYKFSQHGTQNYYWIVRQDSVNAEDYSLSYLFLDGFSKNNLTDCLQRKEVDPSLVVAGIAYDYDFENEYVTAKENLKSILKKNRKLIQKVKKNWPSGQEAVVRIYATPIKGEFCHTKYHWIGQERTGYNGEIFLPVSNFTYLNDGWKSDLLKFILDRDFSNFEFGKIQNYP